MAADNFLYFTKPAKGSLLQGKGVMPEGETTDAWFVNDKALEIASFSFGVAQAETSGSQTGGASAGKAKFEEFSMERFVDQASCPLYNACTAGAHYPTVMLSIRKAGGNPLLYIQFCFRQVYVTGINWQGGGGEEGFKETVKFKFGAMGIQYCKQNADGTAGTKVVGAWNTTTNIQTLHVEGLPDESNPYKNPSQG